MKRHFRAVLLVAFFSMLAVNLCGAKTINVGGNPLNVFGYYSQTAQVSTEGDHWDTEEGLNALLANLFIEGDYSHHPDWSFYGAGMLSMDLIYPAKFNDSSWERKQFDKSDDLFIDDEWWQLLKELHATWKPGNFTFRLGKQRVSWGEMEVFATNDQINPVDTSRGLSEVELETLFIPIPMFRAQYDTDVYVGPIQDAGIQFIFNPNWSHISNFGTVYGNDAAGIWAVDVVTDFGFGDWRLGRQDLDLDEPDDFEYGLKANATIAGSLFSIMGFYGQANNPVNTFGNELADDSFTVIDTDGNPVVNLKDTGYYPRQKFIGAATATQLPLRVKALGGIEPVVRLEAAYQIENEYFEINSFDVVESDALVVGFNFDYKIRLPWQKQMLFIFGEIQYNKLLDYESGWDLSTNAAPVWQKDWFNYYFLVNTSYMRAKLVPQLEWYALDDAHAQIISPSISYTFNERWSAKIKANFFTGSEIDTWGLENKSNIVFKFTHNFQ